MKVLNTYIITGNFWTPRQSENNNECFRLYECENNTWFAEVGGKIGQIRAERAQELLQRPIG